MSDSLTMAASERDLIEAFDPRNMPCDPFPTYRALREHEPVRWIESANTWFATRYADVLSVARDDKNFHQRFDYRETRRNGEGVREQAYFQKFRRMLFMLDGPDHRRVRVHFAKWFIGPSAIRQIAPAVEEAASDLLDELADTRAFDFAHDYAHPLPLRVIAKLLNIPKDDEKRLAKLAGQMSGAIDSAPKTDETRRLANEAVAELGEYFSAMIADRRKNPGDDVVSSLVQVADEGGFADEDELLANVMLLFQAGHETTAASLTLALLNLHRNPDELAKLKASPEMIPMAVQELLRFDAASQAFSRSPLQDMVVGGKEIKVGEFIMVSMGAANRDPSVFADPDRLILDRKPNNMISFGGGAHMCVAHMLARAEMEIGLRAILKRRPELELVTTNPPASDYTHSLIRGLTKLEVAG